MKRGLISGIYDLMYLSDIPQTCPRKHSQLSTLLIFALKHAMFRLLNTGEYNTKTAGKNGENLAMLDAMGMRSNHALIC